MRKLLVCTLVLTMPLTTFAAVSDLHPVIIQNNETQESFTLTTETTTTAYRTETVESTCYSQEIVGYEDVCDYNRPYNVVSAILTTRDRPMRPPGNEGESGKPSRPTRPVEPSRPSNPNPGKVPTRPSEPSRPTPTRPTEPTRPTQPSRPTFPTNPTPKPERPPRPPEPSRPTRPTEPSRPTYPTNPKPERPPRPPEPSYPTRPTYPTYPTYPSEPRPQPRPPVCYKKPIYQSVAYSCMKTVSVPYQVTVAHNENVNVKMSAAPATRPQAGNCGVNFNLTGKTLSAVNTCADYIAIAKIAKAQSGDEVTHNYDITLLDGVRTLAPLAGGLKGLKVESGSFITAKVGNLNEAESFTFKLYVERKKFLGKDVVLINRALKPGEFSYQAIDDKTGYIRINADKVFGGIQNSKKHNITLSLQVNVPAGTVIDGGASNGVKLDQSNSISID